MILAIHIVSAIVGTIGAYLWGFSYLFRNSTHRTGVFFTITGLIGVIISGSMLFTNNPSVFLESGKFLSNMTVMAALIIVEGSFFVITHKSWRIVNRTISVFSWTWIFLIALLNPPFPYTYFMAAYIIIGSLVAHQSWKFFNK